MKKVIPMPKLLINDHNKLTKEGGFTKKIVIPATISHIILQKLITYTWKTYLIKINWLYQVHNNPIMTYKIEMGRVIL